MGPSAPRRTASRPVSHRELLIDTKDDLFSSFWRTVELGILSWGSRGDCILRWLVGNAHVASQVAMSTELRSFLPSGLNAG